MAGPIERSKNYLRWLYEVLFSIYLPLLILSAHEEWPVGRWATRFLRFGVSHGYLTDLGLRMEDNRVEMLDFLLIWILITLVFVCVHALADSALGLVVLKVLAGGTAIAGYPLALLYAERDYRITFLYIEVAISAVCVVLWAYRRWPASKPLGLLLLLAHYALWASFGAKGFARGWMLLWPAWYERPGSTLFAATYPWLIYPLLGLCFTLVWAAYFRQSGAVERDRNAAPNVIRASL